MPARSQTTLLTRMIDGMNDLEWKLSQLEECMLGQRMAEEIADTKIRITDVEGVLMEQFDDRSEVGSLVNGAFALRLRVASLHK